jgi:hypothetical protein
MPVKFKSARFSNPPIGSILPFPHLRLYAVDATPGLLSVLELQLRGLATDPITTLQILLLLYRSYGSVDPSAGRQQCYWNKDI